MVAIKVLGTVSTMSPGSHSRSHQRKAQRIGAAADANRNGRRRRKSAKCFSNSSTIGPPTKPAVCRPRRKTSIKLLFQFHVRSHQIEKRNIGSCHSLHPPETRFDDTAETCAGFPATMALAGTSLVTTLPAPTMAFSPM